MEESSSQSGKKLKGGPLHCWDFFMDSYHRKLRLAADVAALQEMALAQSWDNPFDFAAALKSPEEVILVAHPDQSIAFATSSLYEMTGYLPEEVLGKKPTIFQGPETSLSIRQLIRSAIQNQQPFEETLLNYRKDGSKYNCRIKGYPVFNKSRELVNFIAFERAA